MNKPTHQFALFFFGMLLSTSGLSSEGSDWLALQSQSNGAIMTTESTGFPYLATAESLKSFVLIGESSREEILPGRNFLSTGRNDELFLKTQHLATQAMTGLYEVDLVDDVVSAVNSDGGLGTLPGYQSNVLNTSSMLEALKYTQFDDTEVIEAAIGYLVAAQNADGGFAYPGDNDSDLVLSAYTSSVLQMYKANFQLTDEINATRLYLLDAKVDGIAWGDDWKTAWALIALSGAEPDRGVYQSAVNQLLQNQQVNGSWQDDTYTTALALRALAMVDGLTFIPPDGDAAVSGVVVDEVNDLPIKNVRLELTSSDSMTVYSASNGGFTFNQIESGDYTLTTQKDGYLARVYQLSIQSQQTLDLGQIVLSRQPDQGILRGVASDAETGDPLTNVTINLDGEPDPVAYTNIDGSYEVALPANEITLTASKTGYQTVTAIGHLVAGQVLEFSPAMVPDGQVVPDSSSLLAEVVDLETEAPLSGVTVELSTGETVVTGADGLWAVADLSVESIDVTVSKSGYQSLVYHVLLQPGVNDLGQIKIKPLTTPTVSQMTGYIFDADTGLPVADASLNIADIGLGTLTDSAGQYSLSGISQLNFNTTITANGYQSRVSTITLQEHGTYNQDFELTPVQGNDIELLNISTINSAYPSFKDVNVDLELANNGNSDVDVRLYIKVLNDQGQVIESYPKVLLGLGSTIQDAMETVPANGTLNTFVKWPTRQNAPGWYDIVVEFYDQSDTTLLLQGSTPIEIIATRKIGGIAEFEPPITTYHAREEVELTAEVANRGNLPIDGGEITAQVKLLNKGYQRVKPEVSWLSPSQDPLLSGSRLDKSDTGVIYTSEKNQLFKQTDATANRELFFELSQTNLYIDDVDVAPDGTIWIYHTGRKLVQLDLQGNVLQDIDTGIHSVYSIEVLTDRVLFSNSSAVYQYTWDGVIERIDQATLYNPGDTTVTPDGVLYICVQHENKVYKMANNRLSLWRDDLIAPTAISSDDSGSIYIAQLTEDNVIKIDPQGNRSVFAESIESPNAVFWDETNEQLYVHSQAQLELFVADGINQPTKASTRIFDNPIAVQVDDAGTRYFADNTGQIMSLSSDNLTAEYKPDGMLAYDLLLDGNSLIALERRKLSSLSTDFTQADVISDQITNGLAVAKETNGNGYLVVQGASSGIVNIANDGTYSEVLASSRYATEVEFDGAGNQYLFDASRKIIKIDTQGRSTQVPTGSAYIQSIAMDENENLYFSSYYDKSIIKISPTGTLETVATFDFIPQFITFDAQQKLLVSQHNTGLVYAVETNGTAIQIADFGTRLYNLKVGENNQLWAKTASRQVSRILADGSVNQTSTLNTFYALMPLQNGEFLYGAYHGVYKVLADGTEEPFLTNGELYQDYVYNIHKNSSDEWLIHTYKRNYLKYDAQFTLLENSKSYYNGTDILTHNDDVYVLMGEGIYKYDSEFKWGEEVITGRFTHIEMSDSGRLYYHTSNSVYEYDFNTNESTLVSTGSSGNVGFDVDSNNQIHVLNSRQNNYQLIAENGDLLDEFYSHRNAHEIIKTPDDDLLISGSITKTLKLRDDGLMDLFIDDYGLDMQVVGNQLLYTTTNQLEIYDLNTLTMTERLNPQVSNITSIAANGDDLFVTSYYGLYHYDYVDAAELIMGFDRRIYDIESTNLGRVLMAAHNSGSVVELLADNSTALVNANTPKVNTIYADGDDILISSTNEVRLIKPDQEDSFGPPIFIGSVLDAIMVDNNLMIIGRNRGYEYVTAIGLFDESGDGVEVGDVVYSATRMMPALVLDQPGQYLDFGSFLPPVSGDYQVDFEFTGIDNSLTNTLHVGNASFATISLSADEVLPGDRNLNLNINVVGADDASITRIDTDNVLLDVESGTNGRAIAADSRGNIYSAATTSIKKITSDGIITDVVTGMSIGNGMAVDSFESIYFSSGSKLMKLDADEVVSEVLTAPRNIQAIALNSQDQLFFSTAQGFYVVDQNNEFEPFSTATGFNIKAIAIDTNDDIYLLDNLNGIYKSSNGGTTLTTLVDRSFTDVGLVFEYEGVNLIADCSDNLLFAPLRFGLFDYSGEESIIVQRTGLTGEYSQVLFGPSVDASLNDMDVLFYDKINSRIMLWTDRNNGKIFSFPVTCGGIDVELHLTPLEQVDINGFATQPSQVDTLPNGDQNLIWALDNVGSVGVDIDLNLDFLAMQEAETRPALKTAKLVFKNTFRPDEDIVVPIDIPDLLARSKKTLDLTLDGFEYTENNDVGINLDVFNGHDETFNGYIKLIVEDEAGFMVDNIPTLTVNEVDGFEHQVLLQQWNTSLNLTGGYQVRGELYDLEDTLLDDAMAPLSVVSSQLAAQVETRIMSDLHEYRTDDRVVFTGMVMNTTQNALHPPSQAVLSVLSPTGNEVLNVTYDMDEIYASANRQISHEWEFMGAAPGLYTVTLTDYDENLNIYHSSSNQFEVVEVLANDIEASVSVTPDRVYAGEPLVCHDQVENIGVEALIGAQLNQMLITLPDANVLTTETKTVDLAVGEQVSFDRIDLANDLAAGSYACVLEVVYQGETLTPAPALFTVLRNNSITGSVWHDVNQNQAIDTDESGVSIEVELYDLQNQLLATVASDTSGLYEFNDLTDGTYVVAVAHTDWQNTTDQAVEISLAQNDQQADFGLLWTQAGVNGLIWADNNGNGLVDSGEAGLAGVSLELSSNGHSVTETLTDSMGQFVIENLTVGDYQLLVTDNNQVLDGSTLTTNNQPFAFNAAVNQPPVTTQMGYQFATSAAQQTVFNDLNGNGLQETGESGIPGLTIELSQQGQLVASQVTDANGLVQFSQLVAGSYVTTIVDPSGILSDARLTAGTLPHAFELAANQQDTSGIFGYQFPTSSINSTVFNDINANGTLDAGELGIAGVSVDLYNDNQLLTTQYTDANGTVTFETLFAASYVIQVSDSSNQLNSAQLTTANLPYNIELAANQDDTAGLFGYQLKDASIAGLVFADEDANGFYDASEVGLAAIQVDLSYQGQVVDSQMTDGDGLFVFMDLVAGDYQVLVNETSLDAAELTTANQPLEITLIAGESNDTSQIGYFIDEEVCYFDLSVASDYNVMVWNNFSASSSDVQGRMAVGGDLSINHYSVGDQLDSATAGDVLVVGGDITFPSGRVYYGNVLAGGSVDGIGSPVVNGMEPGTTITGFTTLPVDFVAAESALKQRSNELANLVPNTTFESQWGGLYLHGDCSSDTQVFGLDGATVLDAHTFEVDCIPEGATVVFNISGETAGLTNMSLSSLTDHHDKVLFNFYEAQQLILAGIGVEGSVLAPFAEVNNPQGVIHGQLIADSWDGMMQVNHAPFSSTLCLGNQPPVAEDQTFVLQQDEPVSFTLTGTDPENDPLSFVITTEPVFGTLTGQGIDWIYEPMPSFTGVDFLNFIADDGELTSEPGQVTFEVGQSHCDLYPYTIEAALINDTEIGEVVKKYDTNMGHGNYSLLTWAGENDTNTLAASFTPPGDSSNYVNPGDESDHMLNTGDWVQGAPGKNNARHVRDALDDLIGETITLPLWSETRGSGSNFDYLVSGFIDVELTDYRLNGQSYISFKYLGESRCHNYAPFMLDSVVTANKNEPVMFKITTTEEQAIDYQPLFSAFDADQDDLTFQIESWPLNGQLEVDQAMFTYTPDEDFVGVDELTVFANDGVSDSNSAVIQIMVEEVAPKVARQQTSKANGYHGEGALNLSTYHPLMGAKWAIEITRFNKLVVSENK